MNAEVQPGFAKNVLDLFGEQGQEWLDTLPQTLAEYEQRWQITIAPPFPNLSYNYAAPATHADGTAVVFKASVPGNETLEGEMAALRHYAGHGIARLLEADESQAAMLLERVQPGTQLATLTNDEQMTKIVAGVIRELHRPGLPDHEFPTAAYQARGFERLRATFEGGTGPFPAWAVDRAEALFRELIASSGPLVLNHADLHHYNILHAGDGRWLAIDPQGVVAEAEFEVGAMLRNPVFAIPSMPDFSQRTERRVAILAEMLGFERERIIGWGFAQAVLSTWWAYEDHGHIGNLEFTCIDALARLL